MDMICYFDIITEEVWNYIISFTKNKVYDLCFNDNYKILNNFKYPKLGNVNLKTLPNFTYLDLSYNDVIS